MGFLVFFRVFLGCLGFLGFFRVFRVFRVSGCERSPNPDSSCPYIRCIEASHADPVRPYVMYCSVWLIPLNTRVVALGV